MSLKRLQMPPNVISLSVSHTHMHACTHIQRDPVGLQTITLQNQIWIQLPKCSNANLAIISWWFGVTRFPVNLNITQTVMYNWINIFDHLIRAEPQPQCCGVIKIHKHAPGNSWKVGSSEEFAEKWQTHIKCWAEHAYAKECPGEETAMQEAEKSPQLSTQGPDIGLGLQQEGRRWRRRGAPQGSGGRLNKSGKWVEGMWWEQWLNVSLWLLQSRLLSNFVCKSLNCLATYPKRSVNP